MMPDQVLEKKPMDEWSEFIKGFAILDFDEKFQILNRIDTGGHSEVFLIERKSNKQRLAGKIYESDVEFAVMDEYRSMNLLSKGPHSEMFVKFYGLFRIRMPLEFQVLDIPKKPVFPLGGREQRSDKSPKPRTPKVRTYDYVEDDVRFMLLTEYLEGELIYRIYMDSVINFRERNELLVPTETWLSIATELFEALDTLHNDYSIVHADIKPSNVFYAPKRTPSAVFIDFDLAIEDKPGKPSQFLVLDNVSYYGTYPYCAPEIVFKREEDENTWPATTPLFDVMKKADVWALAMTLYSIAMGYHVYWVHQAKSYTFANQNGFVEEFKQMKRHPEHHMNLIRLRSERVFGKTNLSLAMSDFFNGCLDPEQATRFDARQALEALGAIRVNLA